MNMQNFDIYNPYSNVSVTSFYVGIIKEAVGAAGFKTKEVGTIVRNSDNYGIIIVHPRDYIKAKLAGYKNVILWVQGIAPEESYMRNHSKLRRFVLSLREIPGILFSDMILMVSERMKEHYENKYRAKFADRVFLMPCFNTDIDLSSFDAKDKYEKNIFTYTGEIAVWQCFEQATVLYKKAEEVLPDCFFKVYTPDEEKAERILNEHGVKNYSIGYVNVEQLNNELKSVKYGFVLREENEVNYVATPTKLSTYMANGVIPIFSEALVDFKKVTRDMKSVIALKGFDEGEFLEKCVKINVSEIKEEYMALFAGYYNKERYISQMTECITKLIK